MRQLSLLLCGLFFLTACAEVEKKGVLVDVEPGTPMDESDLRPHCDLGDSAACVLAGTKDATPPEPRFSWIQGVAPSDRAVFAILVPKNTNVSWFVFDREVTKLTKLFTVKPVSRGASPWALQRLDARGLLPGRTYELLAGDAEGHLLDLRTFRTLDLDENRLHVGLLGGWRFASPAQRAKLLADVMATHPQLLVFAGSAVDATLPAAQSSLKGKEARDFFFARHADARAKLALGFARELVPVTALWNDDEYGRANGDRSFPQRDQSREQLELFFPEWADGEVVVDGPGIAKAFAFRRQTLALVDDLTFRKEPQPGEVECTKPKGRKNEVCKPGASLPPPPGSRHGAIQSNWVADQAAKSDRPVYVLANGPTLLKGEFWAEEKVFDSPLLTRAPKGPWIATLEGDRDGALRLVGAEDAR
jgi:hypothetical protein